jgi:hypothetical protein
MNLSVQDESAWLESLSVENRALFLASLSHGLTIGVRVLCHCGETLEQALEWVRLLNEANHRVAGYLFHHHIGDEDTGWLPAVVTGVLSCTEPTISQQAEQAWSYAKGAVLRATSS